MKQLNIVKIISVSLALKQLQSKLSYRKAVSTEEK